ncbi:MAG: Pr6Pr family membrane protein [Microbacterium sp.]|nr:Pr6Pr family membrane protein [Microbacterium sp.]
MSLLPVEWVVGTAPGGLLPTNVVPVTSRAAARSSRPDAHGGRAARVVVAVVLSVVALLVGAALLPWFGNMGAQVPFGAIRPLLYFTVQSNVLFLVALVLCAIALLRGRAPSAGIESLRGLATVDLAITGIVYGLLLHDGGGDLVLHALRRAPVAWSSVPLWLLHPLAWLAVVFAVRGASADHWVPYYFLDPRQVGGWQGVASYCGAIVAVVAVLGVITVLLSRIAPGRSAVWSALGLGR